MLKRFLGYFRKKSKSESVPAPVCISEETADYVIENGVLISYKVTSDVCVIPEGEAVLLDTPYWKNTFGELHDRKRLPLDLVGSKSGKLLNERGYPFFDPERDYQIFLPGEDGIVEVISYVSEDGPDEDGFGREVYYDWWLLDEELKMIPGIPMWHEYSSLDIRNKEKEWKALRAKAAEIIGQK